VFPRRGLYQLPRLLRPGAGAAVCRSPRRPGAGSACWWNPRVFDAGVHTRPGSEYFIGLPDGELARLLFHELAHQVVYVGDDTMFNESFATAVEVAGVERWLATRDVTTRERYAVYAGRRRDFLTLLRAARSSLEGVYRSDDPEDRKRAGKQVLQCQLQTAYQTMRDERWGGYTGYDRFFARPPNNAQLAAVGTYDELVPVLWPCWGKPKWQGRRRWSRCLNAYGRLPVNPATPGGRR